MLVVEIHNKKFLNNEIQRTQNYILLKAYFTAHIKIIQTL